MKKFDIFSFAKKYYQPVALALLLISSASIISGLNFWNLLAALIILIFGISGVHNITYEYRLDKHIKALKAGDPVLYLVFGKRVKGTVYQIYTDYDNLEVVDSFTGNRRNISKNQILLKF